MNFYSGTSIGLSSQSSFQSNMKPGFLDNWDIQSPVVVAQLSVFFENNGKIILKLIELIPLQLNQGMIFK